MQNHVLDYLTEIVKEVPDKIAFSNGTDHMTFLQVYEESRRIGSFLHSNQIYREPVVIFMNKHPKTITAFFGVITAGNFYVPIDEEMPQVRIELILQNVKAKMMICDTETAEKAKDFKFEGQIVTYEEAVKAPIETRVLQKIHDKALDTDPIYIVFTSGSTGIPKGVVACHRSVLDYIEQLSEVLEFNQDTVFGNQTPLYFDACLKELYPTLKFGATTYLVPKELFMFPIKLVEFLNQYKINTVCWVVSALTMISSFKTFEKVIPEHLHTIAFASEVFPIKQFNMWRAALPKARFINLYGPTEVTGICCYYEVDREFSLEESLPIGRPFKNTEIILLDENNKEPAFGEQGEICVRGTSLTLGYYRNPEKTNEAFVQNPLNDMYPELIYRTGDIGRYNERGELVFMSRKDFQIKHMGHRIELGEIEVIVNMHPEAKTACCIFDNEKKKIVLYYVGNVDVKDMAGYIKEKLPRYMVPNVIKQLDVMPLTPNGKINRNLLKQQYEQGKN